MWGPIIHNGAINLWKKFSWSAAKRYLALAIWCNLHVLELSVTSLLFFQQSQVLVITSNTQDHFSLLPDEKIRTTRPYTLCRRLLFSCSWPHQPGLLCFNKVDSCSLHSGFSDFRSHLGCSYAYFVLGFCLQITISTASERLYLNFFVMEEFKENIFIFMLQFLPWEILSLQHFFFFLTQY